MQTTWAPEMETTETYIEQTSKFTPSADPAILQATEPVRTDEQAQAFHSRSARAYDASQEPLPSDPGYMLQYEPQDSSDNIPMQGTLTRVPWYSDGPTDNRSLRMFEQDSGNYVW
jgi:hypothetical protein